jgi:NodT family efflux transporter outer membrane factor (OMF) lipoprotein
MQNNRRRISMALSLACAMVVGCEVGPNYKPPVVKVGATYAEVSPTTRPSVATTRPVQITQWWATFHDPELDSLISQAVTGNLTLAEAESRVRQARAQRGVVGSELFPQINAGGGYQRARGSNNVTIPAGAFGFGAKPAERRARPADQVDAVPAGGPQSPLGNGGLPGVDTDLYQVGFDSTWEIDVFGGQRRSIEAAKADVQAAVEDQRDVLVSLLAEVARNYIDLRGYQRQYAIAQENLSAQQDTLQLTTSKFNAGFVTQLDVARQATQVATTAAELPVLEAEIHSSMHALGVLLGKDPDALAVELSAASPIPPVPPEVPVGLPSELLRRRPDIRRAERRMAAATARVGEATADLYPKFSITGALGLDSTKPKHILDWSSKYWALSPGISWPIFDAGRVKANINVTNEVQKQALDDYQQTVLTALKDVEDSLSSYQTEQVRRAALADAVTAAQQAVELAKQQYNQGVVDFLTVLDAQRAEFATEDSLAQSDQAISTDLVSLYKALGGGWEVTAAATQPPPG